MSRLSNPAGGSRTDASAYIDAVIDLLQGHDPFDVLAQTPGQLRKLLDEIEPDALLVPERPGKWSIHEIVQHLADAELVWGYRLRRVLAEDRPTLEGFDQDRWGVRLQYRKSDVRSAAVLFECLRMANLELLRRMEEADLERVAVHAERGEESVRHMIRLYAGHDLAHLKQINRIRALRAD